MAKNDNDLKKYKRSELLELLIEQGRRIEELERELDSACRALAEARATEEPSGDVPAQARGALRGKTRRLLFDVMELMQSLEGAEEDGE